MRRRESERKQPHRARDPWCRVLAAAVVTRRLSLAFRLEANGLSLIAQRAMISPGEIIPVTKAVYIDAAPAWAR